MLLEATSQLQNLGADYLECSFTIQNVGFQWLLIVTNIPILMGLYLPHVEVGVLNECSSTPYSRVSSTCPFLRGPIESSVKYELCR